MAKFKQQQRNAVGRPVQLLLCLTDNCSSPLSQSSVGLRPFIIHRILLKVCITLPISLCTMKEVLIHTLPYSAKSDLLAGQISLLLGNNRRLNSPVTSIRAGADPGLLRGMATVMGNVLICMHTAKTHNYIIYDSGSCHVGCRPCLVEITLGGAKVYELASIFELHACLGNYKIVPGIVLHKHTCYSLVCS